MMPPNQGATKHALKVRKDDLNETPIEAVKSLMAVEPLPKKIWEPCAGRGAISRVLRAAGHEVVASDLNPHPGADSDIEVGADFLLTYAAPAGVSTIVTNPPFKLANEFVRKGLALDCRVIVLLRLMAIEGFERSDIIDHHLARIWAGRERLPMMHREGYVGKKIDVSGVPFGWFVFDPFPRPPNTPFAVQRMSWRHP